MIDKLTKLSELAPDICNRHDNTFFIGVYSFSFINNVLQAGHASALGLVSGHPALAWLRDAIEGEIEKLRLDYTSDFWFYKDAPRWRIYSIDLKRSFLSFESYTEALLAAFLAAVEEEGR